ncbi:type II secretion system F family protein [Modestobacter roseus]|uniref:Tight adherence protein B n=1 Tax=Modestobacter roseus TaxID=1181884 RepID=A0A562IYC0_9ACTN|nr:type II secretion system F family protein [Modestobacter roseus]MQA34794.1 pilus assembly protein TadB [Modestobacter roseus]TWH75574.1 tight adherence protein B [Modestobacter roseus]
MSAPALLCLALALLAWPVAPGAAQRLRPTGQPSGHRPRPGTAMHRWALRSGPATAALVAGLLLSTPVVAVLAAVCAAAGARVVRARAETVAEDRRTRALAEALGVLVAEVRSGRPLAEAAGAAAAGCPDPATARVLVPVLRLGEAPQVRPRDPLGPALVRLAAAVRLSGATGCSLAAVVGAVEDDLRARLRTAAELRSAVAGPRASATVLAGLPVFGLLMGAGVGADPWRVLTTTTPGTVLLVLGVGLELAGLAWSARLVGRVVRG